MEDEARFRIRAADGQIDKRNAGVGIHVALTPEEKEQVEAAIGQYAPGTANGKFARIALFYFLHKVERDGYAAILADILGA